MVHSKRVKSRAHMTQRMLAFLLVVCMTVGIAPAGMFASAEPEPAPTSISYEPAVISYDFMKTHHAIDEKYPENISEFTSFEISEGAGSAPWKFLADNRNPSGKLFKYLAEDYFGIYIDAGAPGIVSLVLEVPEAGYYQTEALIAYWNNGFNSGPEPWPQNTGAPGFTLTKSDESGVKSGDPISLGYADSIAESNSYGQPALLKPCYLEQG